MATRPYDEIAQRNRFSYTRQYLDLVYMQNDHQDEQVKVSTNENKFTMNLKVNKLTSSVILDVGIVFTVSLLCVMFGYVNSQTVLPTKFPNLENTLNEKREFVKGMMLDSWNEYVQYGWGHQGLYPVSKKVFDRPYGNDSGYTIVSSMSTLWTMGMKDEFERGKKWIETELDLSKVDQIVPVHDVIMQYVGGLLSCYALTKERLFLNKALEIAQLVEPAFNTSKGLPYDAIDLKITKLITFENPVLSYVSGFKLDFNYLSNASGDSKFRDKMDKIQSVLKESGKPKNLYFAQIDFEGKWSKNQIDLFYMSKEFYISLLKSFIQSNHRDVQSIQIYKEALDAVETVKLFEVSPRGLFYARTYLNDSNSFKNSLEYSGCYLGAMLSLGAKAMQRALALNGSIGDKDKVTEQNRINRHWQLAKGITNTCQQASEMTKTGLGPANFYFNETQEFIPIHKVFYISPELSESNFILWRLTHNERYRDNAWQMAQAIHRHCRVEGGGYAAIKDVNQVPTVKKNFQHPQFLSATLKYLYLTFTDDTVMPLDQWVFNSVGHPLPILA